MKCMIFISHGNVIIPKLAEEEGHLLIVKKDRKKYFIRSRPRGYTKKTILGSRSMNAYFVSEQTVTSWGDEEIHGVTIDPPMQEQRLQENREGEIVAAYVLTPGHVFEESDTADLKAFNLASTLPLSTMFVYMGAGAGAMVIIYWLFQTVQKFWS